jgi:hypothetical protein
MSFFAHQHRQARLFINPGYPLYAYVQYLLRAADEAPADGVRVALDAHRPAATLSSGGMRCWSSCSAKPRADRFSANGL